METPVADIETVNSIVSTMEIVQLTALAALAAIAVVAISLFGGIYAWKYGKKVFAVISR